MNVFPPKMAVGTAKRPQKTVVLVLAVAGIIGALAYLAAFWRQSTRPGERHYNAGMEFANAGRIHDAEREWQLGVREDPGSPLCYERLGNLYGVLQRYPAAAAEYESAAKREPDNGQVWLDLTNIQQRLGGDKEALASAREAARLLPQSADAAGLYGILGRKWKDPLALSQLRRANALDPGNARYVVPMVYSELDQGNVADAERAVSAFLKTHPDNTEADYQMAFVYSQKPPTPENVHQGIRFAGKALPGMQNEPRVYNLLGVLFLRENRPDQALRVFTYARRFGTSEAVTNGLLDASRRLGHVKEAAAYAAELQAITLRRDRISHLRQVMGFTPGDVTSGLELARLEEEDGNRPAAMAFFTQLVRQAPKDPRTRPALAAELRLAGHPDLAQKALDPHSIP